MRVLIVDDDVVSRMMLMHMVDSTVGGPGCQVLEAEDGEDAWHQLVEGPAPDILFCDLRMPRLSGMELLARVKADTRFAALPVVLISAANDGATMEQALGLGAAGYIVKPFDAARVAAHLARLAPAPETSEADEFPEATTRRLGIDPSRLLLYLGGLQRQLASAGADLDQLLGAGQVEPARAHLARLGEGCRTLGLHGAAAGLAALQGGAALTRADVTRALDGACAAVRRQSEAARAVFVG